MGACFSVHAAKQQGAATKMLQVQPSAAAPSEARILPARQSGSGRPEDVAILVQELSVEVDAAGSWVASERSITHASNPATQHNAEGSPVQLSPAYTADVFDSLKGVEFTPVEAASAPLPTLASPRRRILLPGSHAESDTYSPRKAVKPALVSTPPTRNSPTASLPTASPSRVQFREEPILLGPSPHGSPPVSSTWVRGSPHPLGHTRHPPLEPKGKVRISIPACSLPNLRHASAARSRAGREARMARAATLSTALIDFQRIASPTPPRQLRQGRDSSQGSCRGRHTAHGFRSNPPDQAVHQDRTTAPETPQERAACTAAMASPRHALAAAPQPQPPQAVPRGSSLPGMAARPVINFTVRHRPQLPATRRSRVPAVALHLPNSIHSMDRPLSPTATGSHAPISGGWMPGTHHRPSLVFSNVSSASSLHSQSPRPRSRSRSRSRPRSCSSRSLSRPCSNNGAPSSTQSIGSTRPSSALLAHFLQQRVDPT